MLGFVWCFFFVIIPNNADKMISVPWYHVLGAPQITRDTKEIVQGLTKHHFSVWFLEMSSINCFYDSTALTCSLYGPAMDYIKNEARSEQESWCALYSIGNIWSATYVCMHMYIYIYRFGFTVSEDKAIYVCDRPCNLMSCACFCVSPDRWDPQR